MTSHIDADSGECQIGQLKRPFHVDDEPADGNSSDVTEVYLDAHSKAAVQQRPGELAGR